MEAQTIKGIGTVLAAAALITISGCNDGRREAAADEPEVIDAVENQQFCPVMDNMPVNEDIYVDYEGKRVYFCCGGCPAEFESDPEKYMEKLKEIHADPDHEPDPAAHDHEHHHH